MDYKIGNSKRIYSEGETVNLTCPHCNNKVEFSVFTNTNTKLVAKFPLVDIENVYFLVCPKCASVFGVKHSTGKTFSKGAKLAIGDFDLVELKSFKQEHE